MIDYACGCRANEGYIDRCPLHEAAPYLLAALKALADVCTPWMKDGPSHFSTLDGRVAWSLRMMPIREQARVIIAKAEGREP